LNATGGGTSFMLYFPTVSLLLSTRSNLNMTFAITLLKINLISLPPLLLPSFYSSA
jgi:hypothetical protein